MPWSALGEGLIQEFRLMGSNVDKENEFLSENSFTEAYEDLCRKYEESGFEPIRKAWLDNAYNCGKKVTIKQNGQECEGIFENIGLSGELVLKTKDGVKNILVGDLFESKK